MEEPSSEWFGTSDERNSFIIVTFLKHAVSIQKYSMKTHSCDGNGHIMGWKLLGSLDKKHWIDLHSITETREFDGIGITREFSIPPTPFVKYIKLIQTHENTKGYHNLRLSSLEFYGKMKCY